MWQKHTEKKENQKNEAYSSMIEVGLQTLATLTSFFRARPLCSKLCGQKQTR